MHPGHPVLHPILRPPVDGRTVPPPSHQTALLAPLRMQSRAAIRRIATRQGFSIDNSVRIFDERSQEKLAQYISRPAISLKKIHYEPFKGRVLFHTTSDAYASRKPKVSGQRTRSTSSRTFICSMRWISSAGRARRTHPRMHGRAAAAGCDQASISHQSASSSSADTDCTPHGQRAAGLICLMLPNVLRPDGEKHTPNRHRPMTIWDAIHFLMTRRKSRLPPASVPGPDSWRRSTRAARRIGAPPDRSVGMSQDAWASRPQGGRPALSAARR